MAVLPRFRITCVLMDAVILITDSVENIEGESLEVESNGAHIN